MAFQTVHKRNTVFPPFPTSSSPPPHSSLTPFPVSSTPGLIVSRRVFPHVSCKLFYIGIVLCSVTNTVLLYFLCVFFSPTVSLSHGATSKSHIYIGAEKPVFSFLNYPPYLPKSLRSFLFQVCFSAIKKRAGLSEVGSLARVLEHLETRDLSAICCGKTNSCVMWPGMSLFSVQPTTLVVNLAEA